MPKDSDPGGASAEAVLAKDIETAEGPAFALETSEQTAEETLKEQVEAYFTQKKRPVFLYHQLKDSNSDWSSALHTWTLEKGMLIDSDTDELQKVFLKHLSFLLVTTSINVPEEVSANDLYHHCCHLGYMSRDNPTEPNDQGQYVANQDEKDAAQRIIDHLATISPVRQEIKDKAHSWKTYR